MSSGVMCRADTLGIHRWLSRLAKAARKTLWRANSASAVLGTRSEAIALGSLRALAEALRQGTRSFAAARVADTGLRFPRLPAQYW